MPHSSGGGSHGGGSHGGSHGGSSGPRISTHYFAGARRYRKHHVSTGEDEYIYASSKPGKAGLGSVIFIVIFAAVFLTGTGAGIFSSFPGKVKTRYMDAPAVHDDIEVISDEESLIDTLKDYQELTGICPVIYTTFDEIWKDQYVDLESYAYSVYVDNFSDEAHFVIVYSISVEDRILVGESMKKVPDYSWEAIQGDDTDPIITENYFMKFADKVQDGLESGNDPGIAFDEAFKFAYKRAESQLRPGSLGWFTSIMRALFPLLLVAGFFGVFLFVTIRQYKKDKDVEYEEIPLDVDPQTAADAVTGNYHSREFSYDASKGGPVPVAAKVITYAVTVPFVVIGFVMIAAGIGMMRSSDSTGGGFMLIFGTIWTLISIFTLVTTVANFVKAKKQTGDVPAKSVSNTGDTPVAYKSDAAEEDEDYKRMKRKGFE